MKILTVLTYYRPHTSGLTIYAERLAKALVKRGHEVTVMTTQYEDGLPREEMMDGVRVIRVPVAFRVSKGVIAPTFGLVATKLVWEHDVVQMHLPQFDAPGVAFRGRVFGKPSVLTYHCDLNLPTGFFNKIVNSVVHFQNNMAGILANRIVTYTQDYADHSPYLSRYQKKLRTFLPPVELPKVSDDTVTAFAKEHKIAERRPVIGMATRFAAEKGVEILLDAMPQILEKHPNAQVLFAGQYQDVFSEQDYADRLMPRIKEYEESGHWTFLGILNPAEMAAFYPALDALVVPSLNATEAFGLVQIEAMLNNVPCVASALPGVRQPVLMHDMGEVAAIGSADELADGLLKIFADKEKYRCDTVALAQTYDPDSVAATYEKMFAELMR
ncbi:MAG: glycosyltransferase family 4 protein [Anaerolineae bacterium]|jgi:glycosyltransferase involved in cell wall biosynthesis|nr:glycosyltransferase family 4 protein [Anaerolineae bacterium]MBT7072394.1 glycosyltransferase family 4 protein [Anaerolineae bacterium]MBT7324235.1 glycosyltransferase family 4 protein [Anaerolineae bacterium]